MPWNGAGTFTRVYSWLTDAANGIFVRADRMDTDSDDIADGISNCITKDGQNSPIANLPMGGYKHTGWGGATSANATITDTGTFTISATALLNLAGSGAVRVPTASAGESSTKAASTAFAMTMQSPAFSGTPTAPTASAGTNNTQIATTSFAMNMQSPAFIGVPTAPTAAPGTNTTQIATTAFATQLAFQTTLPAQPGGTKPYLLYSIGGNASWGKKPVGSTLYLANNFGAF